MTAETRNNALAENCQ